MKHYYYGELIKSPIENWYIVPNGLLYLAGTKSKVTSCNNFIGWGWSYQIIITSNNKNLTIEVSNDETTYTSGSYTTAYIPKEVLEYFYK